MKNLLKAVIITFCLPIFLSNAMEDEQISDVQDQNQEIKESELAEVIKDEAKNIANLNYRSLRDLENYLALIIEQFEGKNKQEYTDLFLEELIKQSIITKIRNIATIFYLCSSKYKRYLRALFNDTLVKCNSSIFPQEDTYTDNPKLMIKDLPQEILQHILNFGLATQTSESLIRSLDDGLVFVSNVSSVCKQFYLTKFILINALKKVLEQKILHHTLLDSASQRFNYIGQILILSQKVNINEPSHFYDYALTNSLEANNKKLAECLLKAGADTEIVGHLKHTPLIMSIARRTAGFVKLLLEHNANPRAQRSDGETALEFAVRLSSKNPHQLKRQVIVELLQAKIEEIEKEEAGEKEL